VAAKDETPGQGARYVAGKSQDHIRTQAPFHGAGKF